MHIFFSVGEPSGDQHAAHLIEQLRRRSPEVRVSGLGGPRMAQAGCSIVYPLTQLAVMGLFRVIPLLWKFFQVYRLAKSYLTAHRPDAVVLVDFPGFNWWIASAAKRLGIPVIYYLPPQLWAWAPWRIRRMHRHVDLVLSGLTFETEWYAARGVKALYVGHPFFDEVANHQLDQPFLREWRRGEQPTVALLPGSRGHEVEQNWPLLLETARRLSTRFPQVRFMVANYKESQRAACRNEWEDLGREVPIDFFVGKTSEIIELADCAIMVSGSVSLELLARQTPAVVVYRISRMTYWIFRLLVTCRFMSLPNLIAGKMIMPELLCVGDPEPIVQDLTRQVSLWLEDQELLKHTSANLAELRQQIGQPGATARVAEILLSGQGWLHVANSPHTRAA